jgi:hypothetical protein
MSPRSIARSSPGEPGEPPGDFAAVPVGASIGAVSASAPTVSHLLARSLRDLGVRRVHVGRPATRPGWPGIEEVTVDEPELAVLLADAEGRIGAGPGAALLPGGRLRVGAQPGAGAEVVTLADPADVPAALATWPLHGALPSVEYVLELDLDAPAPAGAEPLRMDPEAGDVLTLSPTMADLHTIVLVGPGVVRAGHVAALATFAADAGVGVVNTWGAKGVFPWDDPHHFGTAGLQRDDFALAGLSDAELVVAAGLDPAELVADGWRGRQLLEVEPWQLAALAWRWPSRPAPTARPRLYTELAAAAGPLYASDAVPLTPARAAADLAAVLPPGGLVAADPGPAGLWIARSFPTREPGSVIVPSLPVRGFAAAAATAAARAGRPAVAVVTDPPDPATLALLDLAAAERLPVVTAVWGADAPLAAADAHRAAMTAALATSGPTVVEVPVSFAATRALVEVAGPVVAWGGGA